MINIFLESERIFFEPLEQKHFSLKYVSWLNDFEVNKYNRHRVYPNNMEKTKSYIDNLQFNDKSIVLAMIDKDSLLHFGNIAIQNIDLINSHADVSIMIGDKEFWGKSYAYEAYIEIFKHIFFSLNLNRIYLGTSSNNLGMQRVAEKLKMKKEGVEREALFKNGEYLDIYKYGLLKREFENDK